MSARKSLAEKIVNANESSSAFFRNNDASSYNTRYLKSIRNKERFQELHWFQCTVDLINEMFPHKPGKGALDPPSTHRQSAATLTAWRNLEEEQQAALIEQAEREEKERAEEPPTIDPTTSTEQPVVASSSDPVLKRTMDAVVDEHDYLSAPTAKIPKPDDVSMVISSSSTAVVADASDDASPAPDSCLEVSYSWDPFQMEINSDFLVGRSCRGLTFNFLKGNFPDDEAKLRGFSIVAGDAMAYKAQVYSKNQSWPFASDPRVVGAIVEHLTTENAKVIIALKWICVMLTEGKNVAITNSNKMDSIHFHHPLCERSAAADGMCQKCRLNATLLLNLCGAAVEKHAVMSIRA